MTSLISSADSMMQYQEKLKLFAPAEVHCLAFSQDGMLIACGMMNLIQVWRTSNGIEIYNFVARSNVTSILWGDERTLYCGLTSGDLLVKVFIEGQRKEVQTVGIRALMKPVDFIALDDSLSRMALGGDDEVTIWTLQDASGHTVLPQWEFIKRLPNPSAQTWPLQVTSVAWPVGNPSALVVSYLRHGVVTWNIESSKRVSAISLSLVPQGSLSPNGLFFVVLTDRQTFDLYKVSTGMHLRTFTDEDLLEPATFPQTNPVIFVHGGEWLLGGGTRKATLWHVDSGGQFQSLRVPALGPVKPITRLAANESSHSGSMCCQVATVVNAQEIVIWQARPLFVRSISGSEDPIVDTADFRPPSIHAPDMLPDISYLEWFIACFLLGVGIYCYYKVLPLTVL